MFYSWNRTCARNHSIAYPNGLRAVFQSRWSIWLRLPPGGAPETAPMATLSYLAVRASKRLGRFRGLLMRSLCLSAAEERTILG